MKVFYLFISIVATVIMTCGPSKAVNQAQMEVLDQLVQSKHFIIESDWAYPMNTATTQRVLNSGLLPAGSSSGNINLIGNSNGLTISGDSVSSYLPYFGERQMQIEYRGTDNAIQLTGAMEDYKAERIKNYNYEITFKAKSKSESFDVYITLTPDLKSTIVLSSSSRHSIRYTGNVEAVEE